MGTLGRFWCIDAGQPHGDGLAGLANADGVAVTDREHGATQSLRLSLAYLHTQPTQAQHPDSSAEPQR